MLVLHLTGRLASDGSKECCIRKLNHDDRNQAKQEALAWAKEVCQDFSTASTLARLRSNGNGCQVCRWSGPLVENDVKFLQAAVAGSHQQDDQGWAIIQHPDGSIWAWNGEDHEFEIDIL